MASYSLGWGFATQIVADDFADVLKVLAENDGACLYWQMPDVTRGKAAVASGAVKMVNDLLVHPAAIEIEEGMAYTMAVKVDDLIDEYKNWNAEQGLDLGSADEHLFDESLTEEQRRWLADFSRRWEAVAREEDVQRAIDRRAHDEGLSRD